MSFPSTLPGYVTGPINGVSKYYAVTSTAFAGVYTEWSTVAALRGRFPDLGYMKLPTYIDAFNAVQGARTTNDLIDRLGSMSLSSASPQHAPAISPPPYVPPQQASATTAPQPRPVNARPSSSSTVPVPSGRPPSSSSSPAVDHPSPSSSPGHWILDVEDGEWTWSIPSPWGSVTNKWGHDGEGWEMPEHGTWSDYDRAEAADRERAEAANRKRAEAANRGRRPRARRGRRPRA
ncbi:hypothetical protein FA95DRAFT_1609342 [Auriscalpium vulgare]|uniref:Uncharacterized protein n=1 Tax=Auriscalpium vulgare TaxID=40419 RepID=A0ACB8RIX5_9AGAM|nr:hypothetical protein FA95DRAFT_1609342 [Auriscalpium vulgare]